MNHTGLNLDFSTLRQRNAGDLPVLQTLDSAQTYIEDLEKQVNRLYALEDKLGEMDIPENAQFINQLKDFKT